MAADREVIVYTTPLCAPCAELTAYLRARGVPFTVTDILLDDAAADLLNEHGIFTAPALCIDGAFIEGFDQQRIDRALS